MCHWPYCWVIVTSLDDQLRPEFCIRWWLYAPAPFCSFLVLYLDLLQKKMLLNLEPKPFLFRVTFAGTAMYTNVIDYTLLCSSDSFAVFFHPLAKCCICFQHLQSWGTGVHWGWPLWCRCSEWEERQGQQCFCLKNPEKVPQGLVLTEFSWLTAKEVSSHRGEWEFLVSIMYSIHS